MTFFFKPLLLTTILTTFIVNGDYAKAHSKVDRFKITNSHYNLNYQTAKLYDLTKGEKNSNGIETLEKALEVANALKDIQAQQKLLIQIGQKYGELGEQKKAILILDQSFKTIQSLDNLKKKTELMLDLSQGYENIGKVKIAEKIIEETIILVNSLEDELIKAKYLTKIALREPIKSADKLLKESQKLVTKAKEPVPLFPFQPTPLDGRISFFGKIDSAINTTNEFSINVGLEQIWKHNEFSFRGRVTSNFDSARIIDVDQTKINLTGEYRHHFDETWKFFTYNTFIQDRKNNNKYDINLIAGPGINIFRKSSNRYLDMGVGLGFRYENSLGKPDDTNFPTVSYLISYRDRFFERLNYRQTFIYNLPVEDTVDSRILSISQLSLPLFENWSLTGSLRYIYLGVPPNNKPTSEINFSTGLTYDF